MMSKKSIYWNVLIIFVLLALITISTCTAKQNKRPTEKMIAEKAASIFADIVKIRRDIHQHPELSGQEVRTAGVIAKKLAALGLEVKSGVGGHGVVGILHGNQDGPVVAYRADMDALPQDIREDVPFKSVTPGISHACGHDVHSAVALGIAEILSAFKEDLPGSVKFIFQPSEENLRGAKLMIADGVLENPVPDVIFAIHVGSFETGKIMTNPGVGLPGYDYFSITLTGGKDIETAAQSSLSAIRALNTVSFPKSEEEYDRMLNGLTEKDGFLAKFIIAMARLDKQNSTDQKKIINGVFKAADANTYKEARSKLQKALSDLDMGETSFEIAYTNRFPDMFCDKEVATEAITPLKAILGEEAVLVAYNSLPIHSEDFACFLQKVPGAMFFVGATNKERGFYAANHSPGFSADEESILVSMKGMTNVIIHYLFKPKKN